MDDMFDHHQPSSQIRPPQEAPPPVPSLEEFRHESPEQIVAENVSQKLLSSALDESHKLEDESQDLSPQRDTIGHSFGEPIIEEPIHQNFEFQSEQRFSGHPIQQYIYDEEEEDEDFDNEVDIDVIEDQRNGKSNDNLFEADSGPKQLEDNLVEMSSGKNDKKEEILYHLSEDNVLTAQSYGYGTDLRIEPTPGDHKLQDTTVYELDTDDPFATPHKHKTRPDSVEQEFERFVDKEPFVHIPGDSEDREEPTRASINLLDLDQTVAPTQSQSQSQSASVPQSQVSEQLVAKESHSMVEAMPDSEPEPNHALSARVSHPSGEKYSDVMPSGAEDTEVAESHVQPISEPTNRSDTDLSPTVSVSPNLDTSEPTLASSPHQFEPLGEQALPSTQSTALSSPIDAFEDIPKKESKDSVSKPTQHFEPEVEVITRKTMPKNQRNESENAVTTSTSAGQCPCGASVWFNPNQLHPTVAELVYWRDPKKSGVVFGSGLAILLSLTFFSIISVVAYSSLAVLSVTLSFRIYKNILQAVQKTNEGHPFKEYLEVEITPSSERIHEIVDSVVSNLNCTVNKLRSVFLVEDIIDSLKFVVLFWCLTYIGSWFNGLTLVILAYLALFSLPKVYEMNKTQIDQYLSLASTQINDITSKIRAKIPFPAKKDKEN